MPRRIIITMASALIAFAAFSCQHNQRSSAASTDPFEGFFASPGSGAVELHATSVSGKYVGSMWADFGPFPVGLTREGSVALGTVTYGGAAHPLRVEHTARGLIVTESGTQAADPLQRYASKAAYEKALRAGGGYSVRVTEGGPLTRPALQETKP